MSIFDFTGKRTIMSGDKQLYVYSIDKDKELLPMNFTGVEGFIKELDKLGGRKSFGNAIILFDGYNDTTDELHEIFEVRKYVKELFTRFPHILYYMNFDMDAHKVLLASLFDFESFFQGDRHSVEDLVRMRLEGKAPQYLTKLIAPKEELANMYQAIRHHASNVKKVELGEKLVHKIEKVFGKVGA